MKSSALDSESKLDYYYRIIQAVILCKQHPVTGLLPASVSVSTHGDYRDAWVRDNVYSILCVYGLALAYRRLDEDLGRTYELEQAVVKLMRGLLMAMMKQSRKVELFKNKQSVENALHAKYSTNTAETVVGDKEWGHLQLDATGVFLLCLAQMTVSGIQIVYSLDEVDFVQNLVFYVERAYRTPDYGIWERGNKINHGTPELNSSSIGMVLAALQAINGINLFGSRGGASSVIHVLPDEITRNYSTLHSALPRESNSKEIDAALLSVISYPAFAVQDFELLNKTRSEIILKLQGNYGCKRFLRDGHQTVLEDTSRLHYEAHELKVFEHIECEWPLFFTYLILDGFFTGDKKQVQLYRDLMKPLLINSNDIREISILSPSSTAATQKNPNEVVSVSTKTSADSSSDNRQGSEFQVIEIPEDTELVPELYIVPLDSTEKEKHSPKSQKRIPNENVPLVWAQSLYLLGEMINDDLLTVSDLDPLGRHLVPSLRAASSKKQDITVQLVLISEDSLLQQKLAMYGLETQTPEQASPITISAPSALREAYSALGANSKLGLTGRPKRPVGTLSTCKLYKVQGRIYAFTPHFMDKEEFYMTSDNDYLISMFEHELLFVKNHWASVGRPTMIVYLTHQMMGSLKSFNSLDRSSYGSYSADWKKGLLIPSRNKRSLLSFVTSLKTGSCVGVRVRLARLQEVVATSCVESLDFLTRKLEQGYLKKEGKKVTWQELLGDIKLKRKSEGKSFLHSMDSLVDGNGKEALDESYYKIRKNSVSVVPKDEIKEKPIIRKNSDYKLKTLAGNEIQRPMSPLNLATSDASGYVKHLSDEDRGNFTFILGDKSRLETAIQMLSSSASMNDQLKLIYYIYSAVQDFYYVIPLAETENKATIKELLEEIYIKASKTKNWSVLRYVAGIMKKVVNSLTINVTDLLIRQKYLTFGVEDQEYIVSSPLNPDALSELIFKRSEKDVRSAPLIQEIITYLGSYVRSEPQLFEGILRIRTSSLIKLMKEEISRLRGSDPSVSWESLLELSPFEIKSLLGYILSARNQTKSTEHSEISEAFSYVPSPSALGTPVDHFTGSIKIRAQSAGFHDGNMALIEVNGHVFSESGKRGLNVLILNPDDGSLIDFESFDTHINNEESEDLSKLIDNLDSNAVVVLSAKDDCFEQLTEAARLSIESLGSKLIRTIGYRDSFCLIGVKSQKHLTLESSRKAKEGPTEIIEKEYEIGLKKERNNEISSIEDMGFWMPSKGHWYRRRKIDGALQRTPSKFYPKVHRILERSSKGISINNAFLPRDPTISEKTPEELNFALQVEDLLKSLDDPAERQVAVECLIVISEIESRNSNILLGSRDSVLDVMKVLTEAYEIFWNTWINKEELKLFKKESGKLEHNILLAKKMFLDLPTTGKEGSLSFLVKAVLKALPIQIDIQTRTGGVGGVIKENLTSLSEREDIGSSECYMM